MLDQPIQTERLADVTSRAQPVIHSHVGASADEFAPFGLILAGPSLAGHRADFSAVLLTADSSFRPRLHVNCVEASTLPLKVSFVERHPNCWQTFVPLDVSRFVVCVMGSKPDGTPDLEAVHVWILDGNVGVAISPGVWHIGATVLDRKGNFVVVWPRADNEGDTEFFTFDEAVQVA
ncbi:ureidoglycolate lyase [Microvirga sp. BT689]|uniref:ureidoglycolate lyase n=1 Tax=Microvirga arvi TaxID=2778731 RepID=UPI00194E2444|nr:ureidoglycolate lyase [Microvirga arvi]MBM6581895.1 ureidoglycolate lyase [Microvirga arvi]